MEENKYKIKDTSYLYGVLLQTSLRSRIVSQRPPVCHPLLVLLPQQGVHLRHLLACLLLPLGRILHVSVECILDLTCADL